MTTSDTQVFCSCLISEASESHTAEQSVYWLQEAARIIDEQQRSLATTQRELEEARADSRRLDWLEKRPCDEWRLHRTVPGNSSTWSGRQLRAAIDAAMEARQ